VRRLQIATAALKLKFWCCGISSTSCGSATVFELGRSRLFVWLYRGFPGSGLLLIVAKLGEQFYTDATGQ
jgi:hypothetical protein